MMNFRQFLNEKYRDEATLEEAVKIFKEKCKNVDLENGVLYRGLSNEYEDDYLVITGENGSRKSVSTSNHYTKIIDHNLKGTDYPLRSKSIICSNSFDYAYEYSDYDEDKTLVVIPFDGVKIGVCEDNDIWETKVKFKNYADKIHEINHIYRSARIADHSFETIVNGIEKAIKDGKGSITNLFTDDKSVKEQLEDAYSIENLGFNLIENKDISKLKGSRECWIGGSCLAIKYSTFEEFKKLVEKS